MKNPALERQIALYKAEGASDEEIAKRVSYLNFSPHIYPSISLEERLVAVCTGEFYAVPWPWQGMNTLCQSLTPGAVTVFVGGVGASKSFSILQCINYWTTIGERCCVLEIEKSRDYHMHRMLAQLEDNGDITDLKWCKENPFEVKAAADKHREWLNIVGHAIHCAQLGVVTYEAVLGWIQDRCEDGNRIVVVDPITAAKPNGRPYEADLEFMAKVQEFAVTYKASIVVVSHPAKDFAKPDIGTISGGTAIGRFIDCALWLESVKPDDVTVYGPCGRHQVHINRVLHLLKVRDGRGQGMQDGMFFSGGSLKLEEMGIIIE